MKIKIIKDAMNAQLWEMARVGFVDDYEIYIHTDDPGNIPHFHMWDAETRGNKFHTCIRIDAAEYFHHTGKEGVLNTDAKKELMKFLTSAPKNKKFSTNWELLVYMWNLNNSSIEVDENQPIPNYRNL